jgi:transposase-like protein
MPRHYPPDSKTEALQILQANGGDITAAHYKTGIPYRTLYAWRQELFLRRQTTPPLPQKKESPISRIK